VIVESPSHADGTCLMAQSHVGDVLRAYEAPFAAIGLDRRIAHITIFKNQGKDVGASLEHPHWQLIAAPVISQQIRERFQLGTDPLRRIRRVHVLSGSS
jgi:UDPglucose--hexose-1-phosphate uridylyltransferase